MYHYTGCGLPNIWLANGFTVRQTAYGKAAAIENVEGLHKAIACDLINYKAKLTGTELRFLRKEMGMSQKRLAGLLGTTEQSLSLWERKGNVPKWADRYVRLFYLNYALHETPQIVAMIDQFNEMDREAARDRKRTFAEGKQGWKKAA